MRDLRMRGLSRRTVIALVVMTVGVAVIAVALLGGSGGSNGAKKGQSGRSAIEPVKPIDPNDKDAKIPRDDDKAIDLDDPFATSFGASGRRKVTVRVSADGYVGVWVYYRDRKKPQQMAVRTHSATRTVKGRFPMAAVAMQIPGNLPGRASRATCTIIIDGVEVATVSTSKPWAIRACLA
jgi:hypothetical protein